MEEILVDDEEASEIRYSQISGESSRNQKLENAAVAAEPVDPPYLDPPS